MQKHFYMLCGQSGSGKTTMLNAFKESFHTLHYDEIRRDDIKSNIDEAVSSSVKPVIIDIPIKISTLIKEFQDEYDITCIFILEDIEVIKERIANRNGRITKSIERRYKRMRSLNKKYGTFSGTYNEVEQYLKTLVKENE